MDAAYLRAALPEPFTIFGFKLKPFCLGHELMFQRLGNRFSVDSKERPTSDDLMIGLFVCTKPFPQDISLSKFRVPIRIKLASWIFGTAIVVRAMFRFSEYVESHCEVPEFFCKESSDKGKSAGAPTVQALKVSLMCNLGLSENDALNTPYSLALWNHLTWAESQSAVEIVGDEYRNLMEGLKETEASVLELQRRMNAKS